MLDIVDTNETNEKNSKPFKEIKIDNDINNTNNDIKLDSKNTILVNESSDKEIEDWKLSLKNNLLSNIEDDFQSLNSDEELSENIEVDGESDKENYENKDLDEHYYENSLDLNIYKKEEKILNDENNDEQNNHEIKNDKFNKNDKNTINAIDRNLNNKKNKDFIPEEKISLDEKNALLFDGRLFKKYNRENKYKNKKNIKRIVYKCSHYRKNEKIKKDIKTKSFCLATIIYTVIVTVNPPYQLQSKEQIF